MKISRCDILALMMIIDNLCPPSRPSLEKYFKPSLGVFQLERVAKACVELFWKFKKNRFGRFCDLLAWSWRLFQFWWIFSLPALLSSLAGLQAGWKSTRTEKWASSCKKISKSAVTFLFNFQNSSTLALATPSNWQNPSQSLKYFSRATVPLAS